MLTLCPSSTVQNVLEVVSSQFGARICLSSPWSEVCLQCHPSKLASCFPAIWETNFSMPFASARSDVHVTLFWTGLTVLQESIFITVVAISTIYQVSYLWLCMAWGGLLESMWASNCLSSFHVLKTPGPHAAWGKCLILSWLTLLRCYFDWVNGHFLKFLLVFIIGNFEYINTYMFKNA